jgi:hypothetical protein
MTSQPPILATLLAAGAIASAGATPAFAGSTDRRTATRLLRATVWTTYGTVRVAYTTDERVLTAQRVRSSQPRTAPQ